MLEEIADRLRGGRNAVLVHGNADMDAVGSAYGICATYGGNICALGGMDRVSRMVSEKMEFSVAETFDPDDYDTVCVVDTSSPEQLGQDVILPADRTVIIDHHMVTGKWEGYRTYIDDTKVACTEIILQMLKDDGMEIRRDVGMMLLGGMLTDSGHFQFADPCLMRDFAYVMEVSGIHMDEALALTKSEPNMSERTSVMKCIGRSKFERVGDMIVATSYGGSFESSGCRALMLAGADVAFVASQRDDSFRMSGRATQDIVRRGISLGDIMNGIGTETDTDGGGHEGAAGITGTGDAEAMLHICMQRTMEEFRRMKNDKG